MVGECKSADPGDTQVLDDAVVALAVKEGNNRQVILISFNIAFTITKPELFMERFIINTVHNIDLDRSQLKNKPIFTLKKGILIL